MNDDPFKPQPPERSRPAAKTPECAAAVPEKKLGAWQPFTPQGVAAFAHSPSARVLALKTMVALLATVIVVWFLRANYFPAISEAVTHLPDGALLENGVLTNVVSGNLAQRKFLSAVVDLGEFREAGQTTDLQIELHRDYFQICSLLGCGMFEYPREKIPLGRSKVEPWWDARRPVILALAGVIVFVALWLAWNAFALLFAPIVKLIAYFAERDLSWSGSWRLACAGQMLGALLMCLTVLFYGIQVFDLIRFLFFFAAHFLVAWTYVFAAPFFLPRNPIAVDAAQNPFETN
ncbi:MAG: hypothetical protein ABJC04_06450 [Verrucomicrobiota bacterium]